jgi:hypothetical protein
MRRVGRHRKEILRCIAGHDVRDVDHVAYEEDVE